MTFSSGIKLGNGYFAHLSCTEEALAVVWESITGSHTSTGKQIGWAVYSWNGEEMASGVVADGSSAAATGYLSPDATFIELLWLKVDAEPLVGTLRHQILSLIF